MQYLIFSDLHGNIDALIALLKKTENMPIDGYIFCGDITGYYYDARRVVEILLSLHPLYIVKGNHDELYRRLACNEIDISELVAKFGHSYSQIDPDVVRFVSNLPQKATFHLAGYRIMLVHGSPWEPLTGRIYPDTPLPSVVPPDVDFVLCGHTHYQMYRQWGACKLINPGSLGQPRDGHGFSYCLLDFDCHQIIFDSVLFDLSALEKKIRRYDGENTYLRGILYRRGGK